MTGKRRVFVLKLWRDGEHWRGRIKDNDADEVAGTREHVLRELEMMALAQVIHDLRSADAPLIKAVVFEREAT